MDDFREIDVSEANALIQRGGVTLVDIRDPGSYAEAHIPDAVSVDQQSVQEFIQRADKQKPLICYCYHGISSQSAAQFFKENGFSEVYSITGGFEEYRKHYPPA